MKKFISMLLVCIWGFAVNASAITNAHYIPLNVPNINSSFKTWMDYDAISSRSSPQWKCIHNWCWVDWEGFVRCNGERDLGINDDYYAIAMGSFYGSTIGTKYKITLDTNQVIYCILCDQKADIHTNSTHQYSSHNDILEFIINVRSKSYGMPGSRHGLNQSVRIMGNANVYQPLKGNIVKIERIDFN